MVKNMNRPKTITQLSREQLEDFCLNLFHVDNEKANIIEELELKNEALEKELKNLKQPTIFIDTQDMEERYCNGLYVDYLEEENQSLKDRLENGIEYINNHTIEWVDEKFKENNIMVKFDEYSNPQALLEILKGDK